MLSKCPLGELPLNKIFVHDSAVPVRNIVSTTSQLHWKTGIWHWDGKTYHFRGIMSDQRRLPQAAPNRSWYGIHSYCILTKNGIGS